MKEQELKQLIKEEIRKILNEKYIGGLHQAKPGDIIIIGIEGTRLKRMTVIDKVVENNRLQDRYGNIFDRNGIIYKRKRYPFAGTKGKIISAKIVTQKEFDKDYKDLKIDHLRKYDWNIENINTLEKIISQLKVGQGNIKRTSRF